MSDMNTGRQDFFYVNVLMSMDTGSFKSTTDISLIVLSIDVA